MARIVKTGNKYTVLYSENEKRYLKGLKVKFPDCKGTYPDCPEIPIRNGNIDTECIVCPIYVDKRRRKYNIGYY